MISNCNINASAKIEKFVNLYGCTIEEDVSVGPFVEIQKNALIGKGSKVSSHSFICSGVSLGENTFVGHGVMFINDIFSDSDSINKWKKRETIIGKNARIGSNSTVLPVVIGDNTIIGAGSVVTKNIPSNSIAYGNPAKIKRRI